MSSNIRETDNHLSIGKGRPVKVVAPGVIGGLVPTGNIKAHNLRTFLREKVFAPGRTRDWDGLTLFATGERLSPKAFAEDFKK